MKCDWEAWNTRSLAEEPIVRLISMARWYRVRLDPRKATSISLLVVIGVRADGQKVLLAVKSMGGESAEAWRTVLDDLIKRELFWALLASGQINMRKIDRWQTVSQSSSISQLTSLPDPITSSRRRLRHGKFQPTSRRHRA